ncbi:MAG: hypothetical protein ABEH65_04940 [Halobacteriales archaeon]
MGFIAEMAVPTAYGLEWMAGFERWFASKLPTNHGRGWIQTNR